MYNPDFKGVEFDTFKSESGTNASTLTPQTWIESTDVSRGAIPAFCEIGKIITRGDLYVTS